MGYSLRQPSNEGNACYDGFLGHPRKRGEHAACTPFQMHPQWGHESLHLQTGHPLIGGIQNGHPLTFLDRTTPAYAGKIAQGIKTPWGGYPRYSRFSGQPHVCGDMRPNRCGITYRVRQPLRGDINHGHYVGSLRLCKADIAPRFHAAAKPETPPRIQGALCLDVGLPHYTRGITPAHAGNTRTLRPSRTQLRSPPHMRGAQKRDASRVNTHRITPTYAGRTVTIGAVTASVSNHHRVCEEHIKYVYKSPSRLGTPPRMRGTQQNRTDGVRCSRIIPTYVRSTQWPERRSGGRPVHPRICGEHMHSEIHDVAPSESSPRMRGVPITIQQRTHRLRIIPAYAGSTQ